MTVKPSPLAQADLTTQGEQAIHMMQDLGWRDGEAFVDMILSIYHQGRGDYARALEASQAGLRIASEIGHRQWMAANRYDFGLLYFDFLAWPEAIQHLEAGLELSRAIRSQHWTRCHIGMLSVAHVNSQALDKAAAILATATDVRRRPQSIGERLVTYGRACLAQARGHLDEALEVAETLLAAAGATQVAEPSSATPLLLLLRGSVFMDLGRLEAAEADFHLAIAAATSQGERPLVWRLRKALGQLLERQARPAEAAQEYAQARALVAELAAGLPEARLRDNFRLRSGLFD